MAQSLDRWTEEPEWSCVNDVVDKLSFNSIILNQPNGPVVNPGVF